MHRPPSRLAYLLIFGAALLATATVAVLAYMAYNWRDVLWSSYPEGYPYYPNGRPHDIVDVSVGIRETSITPPLPAFACGIIEAKPMTRTGWIVEDDPYLCLSIPHPEDWRLIMPRNVELLSKNFPMLLEKVEAQQLNIPVALIYPLQTTEAKLPYINATIEEIRSKHANIGTVERPVYSLEKFEDPTSGGRKMRYSVIEARWLQRIYLIKEYDFVHSVNDVQANIKKAILEMIPY